MDKKVDISRIGDVLSRSGADIVCLQEVDRGLPRSGFVHQAEHLALSLRFDFSYHANFGLLRSGMGNAILSRYPLYSTWNSTLPFLGEPRGVLHSKVQCPCGPVDVFCTHWGLSPKQRIQQSKVVARKLLSSSGASILCGDLNAIRSSVEVDSLIDNARLVDIGPTDEFTYPSDRPVAKIDYILVTSHAHVNNVEVIADSSSDHLAICSDLSFTH